jgi:hypothetical protein
VGWALLEQALIIAAASLAPPFVGVVPRRGGKHRLIVGEVDHPLILGTVRNVGVRHENRG